MELADRVCGACEGGVPPLTPVAADAFGKETPEWHRVGPRIQREWLMPNFAEMVSFVRDVADLAEDVGHHPDIHMTDYRMLQIVLWTHAIDGLSENDYILAAKIDRLWNQTRA